MWLGSIWFGHVFERFTAGWWQYNCIINVPSHSNMRQHFICFEEYEKGKNIVLVIDIMELWEDLGEGYNNFVLQLLNVVGVIYASATPCTND